MFACARKRQVEARPHTQTKKHKGQPHGPPELVRRRTNRRGPAPSTSFLPQPYRRAGGSRAGRGVGVNPPCLLFSCEFPPRGPASPPGCAGRQKKKKQNGRANV